jgi:hypothetical protein
MVWVNGHDLYHAAGSIIHFLYDPVCFADELDRGHRASSAARLWDGAVVKRVSLKAFIPFLLPVWVW